MIEGRDFVLICAREPLENLTDCSEALEEFERRLAHKRASQTNAAPALAEEPAAPSAPAATPRPLALKASGSEAQKHAPERPAKRPKLATRTHPQRITAPSATEAARLQSASAAAEAVQLATGPEPMKGSGQAGQARGAASIIDLTE
jgi:hypothetical protein